MFAYEVYEEDGLRLGLSHLNEHRFNHNFGDCINPLCSCSLEIESTVDFFQHRHNFVNIRNTLFNKLNSITRDINNCSDELLTEITLYGIQYFHFSRIQTSLTLQ